MTAKEIKKASEKIDNNKIVCTVKAFFGGGVSTVIECTEKDLFEIKALNYNFRKI